MVSQVDDVCCHNITLRGDYFGTVAHGPPTVHLDETPCSVCGADTSADICDTRGGEIKLTKFRVLLSLQGLREGNCAFDQKFCGLAIHRVHAFDP